MTTPGERLSIAVVGGGISGLVAAWLLSREHDVHVFEADEHLGGHTLTRFVDDGGRQLPVDMGFIVHNDRAYPNFVRLMGELGVERGESDMSFSVRCERTGLEWNGSSLNQVFAQRRNLLRPSHYSMLLGILRFHRLAPEVLASKDDTETLGEFLDRHRFSKPFVDYYLVPMAASVWSTEPRLVFEYPVRTLVTFLQNHGMLQVKGRPRWKYLPGGSKTYVEAIQRTWNAELSLATPVDAIRRHSDGVEIRPRGGESRRFDHVVIATHSDQALQLLDDPTDAEREVLGAIRYQDNEVVLHTDPRFMPHRPLAWASWNAHIGTHEGAEASPVQLTYYMNRLQRIPSDTPYLVTLNRTAEIPEDKIIERRMMAHPLYTRGTVAAQKRWADVSCDRTWYCGAYWGWGFHEDGTVSGVRVADALGARW